MSHHGSGIFLLLAVIGCFIGPTVLGVTNNVPLSGERPFQEIWGAPEHGWKPLILVDNYGPTWMFDIEFVAQTDIGEFEWLKITNRVRSKLQLWLADGTEAQSTNLDLLTAMRLPALTTVSNIMRGVQSNRRGLQWLSAHVNGSTAGQSAWAGNFKLGDIYDVAITNEVVLQITPLLYRVDTNREMARLVEFAPIRMKLMPDGNVQKIEQKD